MKLKELLNTNLDGWQLALGYFLELNLDVMGFCPLVVWEYKAGTKRKIVIALSAEELHKVWADLPPRQVRLNTLWVMVNPKEQMCIPVDSIEQQERSMNQSSEEYFFLNGEQPTDVVFAYADSGVLSLRNESGAQFPWPKAA